MGDSERDPLKSGVLAGRNSITQQLGKKPQKVFGTGRSLS